MWSSVVSDPLDELAADPDVISGGGEDFSAFVMSRWPGLVRLAFGLTGDRWAAEDIAQATLARAFVAWRRVRGADDPDAYLRRILVNTSNRRFRRRGVADQPGDPPETAVEGPVDLVAPVDVIIRRGRGIGLRRVATAVGGMPLSYSPAGLAAPTGYAVQVSPGTARLKVAASDGSVQLITPRVVEGRRYAAFVIGTSRRLERLTWLDATGKAFASTTALPRSGYAQFRP
jgi:hypothetical protein